MVPRHTLPRTRALEPGSLATERDYQRLVDALADPVFVLDVSQEHAIRIVTANAACDSFFGVPSSACINRLLAEWELSLPHIDRYSQCIRRVIETGKPQTIEMDFRDPSSGQTLYHQIRYAPEWAPEGQVLSIIGVGRDITQLKAAETALKALNTTLEDRVAARTQDLARANADLRSFASTVSHDLRAPLRAIRGYLALLVEDEGERLSADGRTMLRRVAAAASKLEGLINAILEYSQAGQDALTRERVAMETLARESVEELVQEPASVRIESSRERERPSTGRRTR